MKPSRILVVEDDKTYSKLLQSTLTVEGFEVSVAENGNAALQRIAGEAFDLILTDVQMPKLDGYEFVHELQNNLKYKNIPVIMLTASLKSSEAEFWSRELGAKAFITKSGHYKEIIKKVNEVLMTTLNADKNSIQTWNS
ncbi:MAG: response regulator [Bacteroidetes bacterium]|nr:response regulator [Bacteroidota bacterium]